MSIRRQQRIKDYVVDVLYNDDDGDGDGSSSSSSSSSSLIRDISRRYTDRYLTRIKQLNFTPETFCGGIEDISESLFCMRKPTTPYIISLLIFSIELDTFYKYHHSSWYTTDMLVQALVPILLLKTQFNPSYNKCCILYPCFLSFFCLPGLVGICSVSNQCNLIGG